MNWCISLHWKQLPRRRQEEGETGGMRGRQAGGSCSEEGSGRLGRGRRENGERWKEAKRMQGSAETGWSVLRPLAVSGLVGDRFPRDS